MLYLLRFKINYHTAGSQAVAVRIRNGNDGQGQVFAMSSTDKSEWWGEFEIPLDPQGAYTYDYIVVDGKNTVAEERVFPPRILKLNPATGLNTFCDIWRYDIRQTAYGSSALAKCIFPFATNRDKQESAKEGDLIFKVFALTPKTAPFRIIIAGESESLGKWNVENGIVMTRRGNYLYEAKGTGIKAGTQYKYVVKLGDDTVWESGDNRAAGIGNADGISTINDGWLRIPQFTDWHGAGIVVPLFSLHSKTSDGIGDFADLKKFVRWASGVGMSCVQLLPINDTTTFGSRADSYPYNIVSAFALNPIYISLKEAGCTRDNGNKPGDSETVDYEKVFEYKKARLRDLYKASIGNMRKDPAYARFKEDNAFWLEAYAVYSSLRDDHKSLSTDEWGEYSAYDPEAAYEDRKRQDKAEFYKFVQYVAYTQMKSAREYARRKGVILKGDIPIGVNLYSCEVWRFPELFNRDMSTGAPPDYFSEDGQNWGFPTYNWRQMRKDGYSWWQERLRYMSRFFDAYRIDHVLGFFRIWEIPRKYSSAKYGHFSPALPYSIEEMSKRGFNFSASHDGSLFMEDPRDSGKYHPAFGARATAQYTSLPEEQKSAFNAIYNDYYGNRNENLWEQGATEKLNIVAQASPMLPCAEDLGMLPQCVGRVLEKTGILSLEIQSMPKQDNVEFADPALYPYMSVATLTTHDMPSFRLWWKKYPDKAARYAQNVLGINTPCPAEATPGISTAVVEAHLHSPSMLCLLSFQDWTAICGQSRSTNLEAEQINDPANGKQYWNYKTHLSIEQLEHCAELNGKIRTLIAASKRDLFA